MNDVRYTAVEPCRDITVVRRVGNLIGRLCRRGLRRPELVRYSPPAEKQAKTTLEEAESVLTSAMASQTATAEAMERMRNKLKS